MGFMKKYVEKYWKAFLAAVAFLTLEAVCDLLQPTIMANIVDNGVLGKNMGYVLQMGLVMVLVTGVGAAAAVSRNIISSNVSQKFGADLRGDVYTKVQGFSFDNINEFETASLVTRLTNDVTQVQGFVHGMMRIFVKAPILCVGGITMATLLNPRMALVLVVVVPIIGLLIYLNAKIGFPFFMRVQKALDKVNGVMREYLEGVRVVKAFNRFDYEVERFHKVNKDLSSISVTAMRVMAIFSPGITLTINIGIVVVLWLGGWHVNNGGMQVGEIIAFTNYMTQILFSLMMISFIFNMFVRAKASTERLSEVMTRENSVAVKGNPAVFGAVKGRVDFEHVYFTYHGASGTPVLNDINFTCMPGDTIGIIGSTGSGKTSLIQLIPRFYDPVSGVVKVDGLDVRDADPQELRNKIAVVPQKNILFTDTIAENIRWGKEDASDQEVEEAAAIAQAHDFISSLAEGYETHLGQGGVNLSGGQKQRVSIARALVKKPEILILDDSTSAVDAATEAKIREGLKEYSAELTCIIIAQRITSVMGADKIVVMDNGQVAGIGTHEQLMSGCEVYREIYRSQVGKGDMEYAS